MPVLPSRVVRFHEYGEPLDVLRDERAEVPEPGKGAVRVRVLATGLNPADWELCRGFMPGSLPRGIGCDVAGVVESVGELDAGSTAYDASVQPGDVVFGYADFAGQSAAGAAEVAIMSTFFRAPEGLDAVKASTVTMVVQTAAWSLELLGVKEGDTVLVNGAGGMVGYAAVQMARRAGATVIATAGPTFAADLEGFGATVTRYGEGLQERVRQITGGADVDLVLDTARPSPGTLATLVALAGGDPGRVMTISNHDEARELGARVNIDELHPDLTPLSVLLPRYASLMTTGGFQLPIARSFPLDDWREAVRLSVDGNPHGKLVLIP